VPLHRQPAYREFEADARLPVSESLARQVISLPIYPDMTEGIQDRIVHELGAALAEMQSYRT
jgi:dTDP-4-amino-4,6-dideoxygalactose transaminase